MNTNRAFVVLSPITTLPKIFAGLGYPATWHPGVFRRIPTDLYNKLQRQGVRLIELTEDKIDLYPEDRFPPQPQTPPPPKNEEDIMAEYRKLPDMTAAVSLHNNMTGHTRLMFEAFGYSPRWKRDEVRVMPMSLLNRLTRSGYRFSTREEDVAKVQNLQGVFDHENAVWMQERAESKASTKRGIMDNELTSAIAREKAHLEETRTAKLRTQITRELSQ